MAASMRAIMDGLVDRLHPDLPGEELGEIFDHLIYMTDDNGVDLTAVLREWLSSDDVRRVDAALSISVLFLYDTREKLVASMGPAAERFPELAAKVDGVLARWDQQRG
ncbi:hypothetical protein ACIA8G_05340 [Lentzea sp. NPDC051213]|uniref:hypothetical protein n=1 Tax=Lentzea sp. NPDC051213 TaxID=3364126 RepID=UPI0037A2DEC7